MSNAIIALDGGGTNLRMAVVDAETLQEIGPRKEIQYGTNLNSAKDPEQSLENLRKFILEGYENLPKGYLLKGIILSSAGTEIERNKLRLQEALENASSDIQNRNQTLKACPPLCVVTNDIDPLTSGDTHIAISAGTGTVCAVKCSTPLGKKLRIIDGYGIFGDKGSGFDIGNHLLTKIGEVFGKGIWEHQNGEIEEIDFKTFCAQTSLVKHVVQKLAEVSGKYPCEIIKSLQDGEIAQIMYPGTNNGERSVVASYTKVLNEAVTEDTEKNSKGCRYGKEIFENAANELFKDIMAAYRFGRYKPEDTVNIVASGSVFKHNRILGEFFTQKVAEKYPGARITICDPQNRGQDAVMFAAQYMRDMLKQRVSRETGKNDPIR